MAPSHKVLVIVGSVRPRRICPQVADWVAEVGRGIVDAEFEIADLKAWPRNLAPPGSRRCSWPT